MNIKLILFSLLIIFMPFFFSECGPSDMAAGFPLFFLSTDIDLVWKDCIAALLVNGVFGVILALTLKKWFSSQMYLKRANKFQFSNIICFSYVIFQFLWAWGFIGYSLLSEEGATILPILYDIGKLPVIFILMYGGAIYLSLIPGVKSLPITELARISLPLALFNLYWISYLISLGFIWVRRRFFLKLKRD